MLDIGDQKVTRGIVFLRFKTNTAASMLGSAGVEGTGYVGRVDTKMNLAIVRVDNARAYCCTTAQVVDRATSRVTLIAKTFEIGTL
jgi:hypothetical protein